MYKIYKPHNEKLYELIGRRIKIWENYYSELNSSLEEELISVKFKLEETQRDLAEAVSEIKDISKQLQQANEEISLKNEKLFMVDNWVKLYTSKFQIHPTNN